MGTAPMQSKGIHTKGAKTDDTRVRRALRERSLRSMGWPRIPGGDESDEEDRLVRFDCQIRIYQVLLAVVLLKKFARREGKKVPDGLFQRLNTGVPARYFREKITVGW